MSGGGCLQFSCDNRVVNSAVSGIALTGAFSVSENLTSRRVGVGLILLSYYYGQGRNNTIIHVIEDLYNLRLKLKKDQNPSYFLLNC